jgi:hypothetical protein
MPPSAAYYHQQLCHDFDRMNDLIHEFESDDVSEERQSQIELEFSLLVDGNVGMHMFFLGFSVDSLEEMMNEPAPILNMCIARSSVGAILQR